MRLLHLIERVGPADFGDWTALACRALIDGLPDADHAVAMVGTLADEHRAASLGIDTSNRINPAPASWAWDPPGLARLAADRGPFDGVLRWTGSDRIRRPRDQAVVRLGFSDRRAGPSPAIETPTLAADRLPVLAAPVADRDRARRHHRARLGIGADETAVVLVGHADDESAGASLVFALGLVEAAGYPVVGVLPASPSRAARARRLQRASSLPHRLVHSPEPEGVLLHAADAVVVCPRGWLRDAGSVRSDRREVESCVLLAACHAGRPVVAPGTERCLRLLASAGRTAHLVLNETVSEVARGVLDAIQGGTPGGVRGQSVDPGEAGARFARSVLDRIGLRERAEAPTM